MPTPPTPDLPLLIPTHERHSAEQRRQGLEAQVSSLLSLKERAVDREDYGEAQRLKEKADALHQLAERMDRVPQVCATPSGPAAP